MGKQIKFKLSTAQAAKIDAGIKKNKGITLRLSKHKISESGLPIILTDSQVALLQDGKQHNIKISATSLQEMSKTGGFLPLLLSMLPLLAGGLTAAAAGTSMARNIKNMVEGR
jgi:hypothetical protein